MKVCDKNNHDADYSEYYKRMEMKVYPSEFLVRAFLGAYPNHELNKSDFVGKRALDLGFGDGRNMILLSDLGMEVHGVEVTQPICDLVKSRLSRSGVNVETKVGRNKEIPYIDGFFDYVIASSSCYYMDPESKYSEHVTEICRVLKPGGMFIHSLPMPTTFIMEDAIDIGEGHMQITKDPYGVRVGAILKKFEDEKEVEKYLSYQFENIKIGHVRDNYWGSKVHLWIVVCTKKR